MALRANERFVARVCLAMQRLDLNQQPAILRQQHMQRTESGRVRLDSLKPVDILTHLVDSILQRMRTAES